MSEIKEEEKNLDAANKEIKDILAKYGFVLSAEIRQLPNGFVCVPVFAKKPEEIAK